MSGIKKEENTFPRRKCVGFNFFFEGRHSTSGLFNLLNKTALWTSWIALLLKLIEKVVPREVYNYVSDCLVDFF